MLSLNTVVLSQCLTGSPSRPASAGRAGQVPSAQHPGPWRSGPRRGRGSAWRAKRAFTGTDRLSSKTGILARAAAASGWVPPRSTQLPPRLASGWVTRGQHDPRRLCRREMDLPLVEPEGSPWRRALLGSVHIRLRDNPSLLVPVASGHGVRVADSDTGRSGTASATEPTTPKLTQ